MNRLEKRKNIAARLQPVAGEDAFLEAGFFMDFCDKNPAADESRLIERRLNGEPIQYVLGEWDFMGLTFHTDKRALIPRPDTETICEAALARMKDGDRVLDMCCGSGCIGISIAKRKKIRLIAADLSPAAIELTEENAEMHGIVLETVQSDLFDRIQGTFDCIVCNPPYLNEREMLEMDPSLRYEPRMAFDGGEDGLAFYRRIRDTFDRFLNPGGWLIMEIGCFQEEAMKELFPGSEMIKDYGGRPRCAVIQKNDR